MRHEIELSNSADVVIPNHFLGMVSNEFGERDMQEGMVTVREGVVQMTDIFRAIETALSMPGMSHVQLARTDGIRFIVDKQPEIDFFPLGMRATVLTVRLPVLRLPRVLWESALQAAQTQP